MELEVRPGQFGLSAADLADAAADFHEPFVSGTGRARRRVTGARWDGTRLRLTVEPLVPNSPPPRGVHHMAAGDAGEASLELSSEDARRSSPGSLELHGAIVAEQNRAREKGESVSYAQALDRVASRPANASLLKRWRA